MWWERTRTGDKKEDVDYANAKGERVCVASCDASPVLCCGIHEYGNRVTAQSVTVRPEPSPTPSRLTAAGQAAKHCDGCVQVGDDDELV